MPRHTLLLGVLLFLTLFITACSSPATTAGPQPTSSAAASSGPISNESTLTVFAAASLTDSFNEIGKAFEAAHPGVKVTLSFAGSQQLRAQIEQGAKADVFASADTKNMDALKTENLLSGDSQVFAHNLLTVIIPKANTAGIATLQDLAKPGTKIVLADASVPVGNYTLQILDKLSADPIYGSGFKAQVLANVVSKETDVKAVVSKVSLGEADAGVVYTTDARAAGDKLAAIDIPDKFNVIATYPISALKGSANPALAQQFVDFVLSSDGQAVLNKNGFARR